MSHFISFLLKKIAHYGKRDYPKESAKILPSRSGTFPPATPKRFECMAQQETKHNIGGAYPRALSPRRWRRQDDMGHFPFSPTAPKFFGRAARPVAPQSGRSMIEMLAVLAIMGVLTVGGIAAYTFAVSKHRANQIYHQVDLRAVASFGNPFVRQTQVGQTYPLAGFDEIVENITYQHQKTSGNGYDIIASHVPERVCRRLQDMTFPVPRSVTLNEADLSSTCGADNTFVFSYDGLSVGKPSSGVTPIDCNCSGCQSCESGTCQDNDNLCGPKEVCVAGSCQCAPGYDECLMGCYTPCQEGQVRQNDTCDCVCTGFKEFDYRQNKCVCQNIPTGGNPETCECDEGYDLVNGVCVQECPDAVGMTGLRNNAGQCLCDTATGYEEISVDDTWCKCDNSRYFWDGPDGACITCAQTTKEWAINMRGDSSGVNRTDPSQADYMIPIYEVDSESIIDNDVWYCGSWKICDEAEGQTNYGECYYNPSTGTFCDYLQVLKRSSDGSFVCGDCGSRIGKWGYCSCGEGKLLASDGTCQTSCPSDKPIGIDGICYKCNFELPQLDADTCLATNICDPSVPAYTTGSTNFNYKYWLEDTPASCHVEKGRAFQSDDEKSACHWKYGCKAFVGNLPNCEYGAQITSSCICQTGGEERDYCCSLAQIRTDSGCQTCTGNTVPNADYSACEACADNEIPSADKTTCQHCPDGQIPNITKTKCYACPDGKTPDASGTACI